MVKFIFIYKMCSDLLESCLFLPSYQLCLGFRFWFSANILGSGPDGRITKKDIESFVPPKAVPVSIPWLLDPLL